MSEVPQNLDITPPDDYGDGSELFELPVRRTRAGGPVLMSVKPIDIPVIVMALKGLPQSEWDQSQGLPPLDSIVASIEGWKSPAAQIAMAGVAAPPVSFTGPQPGHVDWDALVFTDRMAVVRRIMRISGWGAEETAQERRFPAGAGRGFDGRADGGRLGGARTVPVGATATSTVVVDAAQSPNGPGGGV